MFCLDPAVPARPVLLNKLAELRGSFVFPTQGELMLHNSDAEAAGLELSAQLTRTSEHTHTAAPTPTKILSLPLFTTEQEGKTRLAHLVC